MWTRETPPRVHWVTGSVRASKDSVVDALCRAGDSVAGELERGGYLHPRHVLMVSGVKVFYGGRLAQPVVVVVDGEACDLLPMTDPGQGLFGTLNQIEGWRPTRLDLAQDVHGPSAVRQAYRQFKAGKFVGSVDRSSCQYLESMRPGDGLTAYFGSRQSMTFLRVYDRRGPTRFEFEVKQERACVLWRILLRQGVAAAFGSIAKAFGNWPKLEAWQVAVHGLVPEDITWESSGTALAQYVDTVREQHGGQLAMLQALGVSLQDLVKPLDQVTARQLRQLKLFLDDARELQLPVQEAAIAAIQPRRKVKR